LTALTIKILLYIWYTLHGPQQDNVNYTQKFIQEIFTEAETHISPLSQVQCIASNNAFTTILLKTLAGTHDILNSLSTVI